VVRNGGHGLGGRGIEPSLDEIDRRIVAGFDRCLKGKK
jgi:hypothetical protein